MIDFMILYEHRARELENDCLIKAELERRGYKVELINIYEYKRIRHLMFRKPKVILVPFLYDNYDIKNTVLSRTGYVKKIINLQWEQVLSRKWEDVGFHTPKEDAIYATHICWGKETKQRLKESGIENTVLTGPIQVDFLRDEFKPYYKTKEKIIKEYSFDRNKKIILFISSFTFANMSNKEIKEMEKRVSGNVDELKRIMLISKQEIIVWIKKLLKERKDIIFIYRPHPGERNDTSLYNLHKEFNNFKIIDDYSVKQWILISDRIFTWLSTAITEVYFANKNCSILRPVEIEERLDLVMNLNGNMTTNYKEMINFIDGKTSEFPVRKRIIHKYYSVNEIPSYIRICNFLELVLKSDKYNMQYHTCKTNIYVVLINVIMDEIIVKFKLINKTFKTSNEKLKSRINMLKEIYGRYGKEMVSEKDIEKIIHKIKKIIT